MMERGPSSMLFWEAGAASLPPGVALLGSLAALLFEVVLLSI